MIYFFSISIMAIVILSLKLFEGTSTLNQKLECLAIAPAIISILLVFPLITLNTFGGYDRVSYKIFFYTLIGSLLIIRRQYLYKNLSFLFCKLKILNKKEFLILLIFFLGLLGIILRTYSKQIWDGDGQGIWATRGLEWAILGKIQYTEPIIHNFKTWLNYPIFPSLIITSSILMWDLPQAYSANIYDFLPTLGLIFSFIYFVSLYESNFIRCIILGSLLAYLPRPLFTMVGSAYADLWVTYLFTLSLVILWKNEFLQSKGSNTFLAITLSLLSISKSEGIFRAGLLLLPFIFLDKRIKNWGTIITTTGLIYLIIKLMNPSPINYNHYLSDIKISGTMLIDRFIIVMKALGYSLVGTSKNIFKLDWPAFIGISLYSLLFFKVNSKEKKLLFALIFLAFSFNIAPLWLAPIPGKIFNDPLTISGAILVRLNGQVFALFVILGFIDYFKRPRPQIH